MVCKIVMHNCALGNTRIKSCLFVKGLWKQESSVTGRPSYMRLIKSRTWADIITGGGAIHSPLQYHLHLPCSACGHVSLSAGWPIALWTKIHLRSKHPTVPGSFGTEDCDLWSVWWLLTKCTYCKLPWTKAPVNWYHVMFYQCDRDCPWPAHPAAWCTVWPAASPLD